MVAPGGVGLRCVQLQLLKHLGDRVEADGVERLDDDGSLHQLSPVVMMKSRFPKRTCMLGTQLTS